jgi:alkylhydroperoxidase family enzyme
MSRISYVDPATVSDPELAGYLARARERGTPRPESQAIRAHVPEVLRTFSQMWEAVFYEGVLDHRVKELCRLYVAHSVACEYCAGQRSQKSVEQGMEESDVDELLHYSDSARFGEREKAALAYTDAILWDAALADDDLWGELHRHFSEPELVELGSFVALTLGQQRWIKTLRLGHREVAGDTTVGLAPTAAAR